MNKLEQRKRRYRELLTQSHAAGQIYPGTVGIIKSIMMNYDEPPRHKLTLIAAVLEIQNEIMMETVQEVHDDGNEE